MCYALKTLISFFIFKDKIRDILDLVIGTDNGRDGLGIDRIRFGNIVSLPPLINKIGIQIMNGLIMLKIISVDTGHFQTKGDGGTVFIRIISDRVKERE